MSVDIHTGEIVPAAPTAPSAVAITGYLQQARDWLATAVETTGPEQIAAAKAEIATAAEATKQLNLSKEIREDAIEMVRRFEYAQGKAIRLAQERGELSTRATARGQAEYTRVRYGQEERIQPQRLEPTSQLKSPADFFTNAQERAETYAMVDGVSEEQFDRALGEAKSEGNLSRANVLRKIKGQASDQQTRSDRADIIRDLAEKGWASRQMTDRVGITEDAIRRIARDYGIHIPGDRALRNQRRVNSNDIVENLVIGLEGSCMSIDLIDFTDLDPEMAEQWATSLTESMKVLNRFAKQIKELER